MSKHEILTVKKFDSTDVRIEFPESSETIAFVIQTVDGGYTLGREYCFRVETSELCEEWIANVDQLSRSSATLVGYQRKVEEWKVVSIPLLDKARAIPDVEFFEVVGKKLASLIPVAIRCFCYYRHKFRYQSGSELCNAGKRKRNSRILLLLGCDFYRGMELAYIWTADARVNYVSLGTAAGLHRGACPQPFWKLVLALLSRRMVRTFLTSIGFTSDSMIAVTTCRSVFDLVGWFPIPHSALLQPLLTRRPLRRRLGVDVLVVGVGYRGISGHG